jgi:hypothetical protein
MGNELYLHHLFQEKEFWNRYENLRSVLQHLTEQQALVERIQQEIVIPEQARDLAAKALSGDLEQTRRLFFEIFENFISNASVGLQTLDVECAFTAVTRDMVEIKWCTLWVEGTPLELPAEIGQRFAAEILSVSGGTPGDSFIQFFEREESHYDLKLGGIQNRCSLQVMEEVYPVKCLHIRFRLPAQSLIDHQVIGKS